jgi:signal transduction histidine kinase
MARPHTRWLLILNLVAIATLSTAFWLAMGPPLLRRAIEPGPWLGLVLLGNALTILVLGAFLLLPTLARPVDRILAAAERLREVGRSQTALPLLGDAGEQTTLPRAAVAFERAAGALQEERGRLAAKVEELTRANRELAEARASLVRSEKLATVGRLAAGVAHEVGNPLGAIIGFVDLALAKLPSDPTETKAYLERIAVEVRRIDRTVRELLDFSRPAPPTLMPIDLGRAAEGALRLARMQDRFKDVEVALEIPQGMARVLADERHLAQVLLNLLLNAGDAMQGAGRVRLSASGGAGRVRLEVSDTGPGIAPDDLPRIFDPFFTTKEPGKGTGLGLSICHRIMESFGGEIGARNGEGRGAVFTLTFRGG